jgi:hypothetical protein
VPRQHKSGSGASKRQTSATGGAIRAGEFRRRRARRFKAPPEFINEWRFSHVRLHLTARLHQMKAWLDWDMKCSVEVAWKRAEEREKRLADPRPVRRAQGDGFVDRKPPMTHEEVERGRAWKVEGNMVTEHTATIIH